MIFLRPILYDNDGAFFTLFLHINNSFESKKFVFTIFMLGDLEV